jgi:hypothetical protein
MDERNPASQLSEATPSLFPQVISLGPTVRPPGSSARCPTVPPFFFFTSHRSSAWDLPFDPPGEKSSARCPTVPPFFFFTRERSSAWTYRSTPPPLWFGYPERERVIGHGAYRSTPCKETSSDRQKRNPVFFFFLPAQKHVDPFTNKGCLCREKPEGSNPRVPTIRLQGRGKGSGGTAPCLRARTTQLPRKKDALRGNTRHSRHRPPKPLHVNIITSLVSAPVAHNDQCKRGLTPRAAPVYRNNALGTMKRLPSVQSPTPLKD